MLNNYATRLCRLVGKAIPRIWSSLTQREKKRVHFLCVFDRCRARSPWKGRFVIFACREGEGGRGSGVVADVSYLQQSARGERLRALGQAIDSRCTVQTFQGRCFPDLYDLYNLYDLYDLYDLAHVAGWEPCNLLHVLGWICTTQILRNIS